MEILIQVLIFIVALAVLLKSSDWFVDSAEKIGLSWGVSPFVIGVTVVAFGTSLPELASSIASILAAESQGRPELTTIVTGNVVGSNITNIVLVLGLVAVFAKRIPVNFKEMDLPMLVGSAFIFWFLVSDQNFELWEAFILITCLIIFLLNTFKEDGDKKDNNNPKATPKDYGLLVLAGLLVWLGAKFTIDAIQVISDIMNISSGFIAQTVIALGTSLPEIAVSISAARKGQSSIAVGNVIGSNIFNTYGVMGISRLFGVLIIEPSILTFALPLMIGLTILLAFMTLTQKISRMEGTLLLVFYVFFLIQSILSQM